MIKPSKAFSGFSVNDLEAADTFYTQVLGIDVKKEYPGMLELQLGDTKVAIYSKSNHEPATFTILNFPVDNIEAEVGDLLAKGVTFEQYPDFKPDSKGICRSPHGPTIAWFKDPAGNVLSLIES